RDGGRLVRVMHNLRDKGNSLLVVEHEETIIRAADNLIDIGPGRGELGGELVYSGTLDEFLGSAGASRETIRNKNVFGEAPKTTREGACAPQSLTRDYLSGRKSIAVPKSRRKSTACVKITGASQHNLKSIDV